MRPIAAIWIFAAAFILCVSTLARSERYYGRILYGSDAQMYFAAAHALLFRGSFDVTEALRQTSSPEPFDPSADGSFSDAPRGPDGRIASKYPLGLSLIELPFLAVGALARAAIESAGVVVAGAPGYSAVEVWAVAIGLQWIVAVGLALLYRMLRDEYGSGAAALGVVAAWMGTSLFYYSAIFPFMAHAVSFALLTFVLFATRGLSREGSANGRLALLGLLTAMVFLVRPQQALIALFVAPNVVAALGGRPLRAWAPGLGVAALAMLGAIALQAAFTFAQLGVASPNGYGAIGEGFALLEPRALFVLFSGERGLLFFSPVVLLAAVGFAVRSRSVPKYVWPTAANAVAQIYLISAWSSPGQGDSFGARMWSDNAAAVAFGVAILHHRAGRVGRPVVAGIGLVAAVWSLVLLAVYLRILR